MITDCSAGGWRVRPKGYTRRMVEDATLSITFNGTRLISPPSPPVPKPTPEEIARQKVVEEEEWQRDLFFNHMDYYLENFDGKFLRVGAEEVIKDPSKYTGYNYDMAQIPGGKFRVIEARVGYNAPFQKEAEQIARIKLIRKLGEACGNYGANYGIRTERIATGDVLVMDAVPIFLDHGM
jgi:hypothetical protein